MPSHNASEEAPRRGWRCPDEVQLAAYIDGAASGEAKRKIERHISDCSYCLRLVSGTTAAARQASIATPIHLRKRAEELEGGRLRNWRWVWAVGPALACLVAIAIFLRQPSPSTPAPQSAGGQPTASAPSATATSAAPAQSESTRALGVQPGTLQVLAPARNAVLDRSHMQFEWTTLPNASYYQVRITTTEGGLMWEGRSQQASVRPPDKMKFAAGHYFIWVTAYLNNGRTERSDPLEFSLQSDR